jgi:hypothetical protein
MTNCATTENENNPETQQTVLEHENAPRVEKNLQNPPSDPTPSRTIVEYPKEHSGEQQTKDKLEEGREDPMDLSELQESMTKQEEETSDQDPMPEHINKAPKKMKTSSVSTPEDTSMGEEDNTATQNQMQETHNETSSSPIKLKKMKVERPTVLQTERTRNKPRRTTQKNGKV